MASKSGKPSQFGEFFQTVKKNPIPFAIIVAGCVIVGVLLGRGGGKDARVVSSGQGKSDLPDVEIKLGSSSLKVQYARTAVAQSTAWLRWVAGRPTPTLLEWDTPGRYPIIDVRSGWVVVWIKDGKVVEVRTPPEGNVNALIPQQACRFALVLPASQRPEGGTAVSITSVSSQGLL